MPEFPETDPFPNAPGLSKHMGLTKAPGAIPHEIIEDGVKKRWYSICSIHHPSGGTMPTCDMCMTGCYLRSDQTADKF